MKKKLFLLVIVLYNLGVLEAQQIKNIEGKPSYEETIEYLKSELNFGDLRTYASIRDGRFSKSHTDEVRNFKFNFEKVFFKAEYDRLGETVYYENGVSTGKDPYGGNKAIKNIDLSKVEAIIGYVVFSEVEAGQIIDKSYRGILWFRFQYKEGSDDIPVGYVYQEELPINPRERKIFKAFEHLRKLCGAPEPIDF